MKIRWVKFIICLIFVQPLFCQNNTVGIKSEVNFESNSLNFDFINSLLYGGRINEETKKNWINLCKQENKIYSIFKNDFFFKRKFKENTLNFIISDINKIDIVFNKDLLKLVLHGNFDYQDQTLNFDNTHIRAERYQKYNLQYEFTSKEKLIKIGLSYLKGNHNISLNINNGSLYTALYGEYLDVNYDVNGYITDTSNINIFQNNGNGVALDFAIKFKAGENKINFYINDLGFIKWNKNSINFAADSTFSFIGIDIDNIYDFNDSIFNNITDNQNYINNQTIPYKSYVSANIGLNIKTNSTIKKFNHFIFGLHSKWQPYIFKKDKLSTLISNGFSQSNYKPLFYISSEMGHKKIKLLPRLSYGGYSEDLNIELSIKIESKISLILGTKHLEDLIINEGSKSFSLFLNIFKIL
jgi:hypothetical protein